VADTTETAAADATRFRRVVAAYEVLSDDHRRSAWLMNERARRSGSNLRKPSRARARDVRWHTAAHRSPPPRPWIFELADSKGLRVLLTIGFIGGQYLSWYLFLVGASAVPTVQGVCGIGPC
jgi:hypothetical protein